MRYRGRFSATFQVPAPGKPTWQDLYAWRDRMRLHYATQKGCGTCAGRKYLNRHRPYDTQHGCSEEDRIPCPECQPKEAAATGVLAEEALKNVNKALETTSKDAHLRPRRLEDSEQVEAVRERVQQALYETNQILTELGLPPVEMPEDWKPPRKTVRGMHVPLGKDW